MSPLSPSTTATYILTLKHGKNHMAYRVEYFREGREIGSTSLEQPLDRATEFAKDGMIRHEADSARIIDVDGCGAEVWAERRDA